VQGNIVLIGFMGTGKSTIGRELSKMLSYPLIDTDHAIAKKAGKSIPKIFAEDGEEAFRKMETDLLEELLEKEGNIIADSVTSSGSPPARKKSSTEPHATTTARCSTTKTRPEQS
jgi:shikimate kinase